MNQIAAGQKLLVKTEKTKDEREKEARWENL